MAVCAGAQAQDGPNVLIGGWVKDREHFAIATNPLLYPLDIIEDQTLYLEPKLDEKNEFRTYISFDRPFYVRYVDNGVLIKGVYAMPGDQWWLKVADGRGSLSGSNKTLQGLLTKLQPYFENTEVELTDTAVFATHNRAEFITYQQERRKKALRYVIEHFIGLPPLEMEMRKLLESEINYSYALKMLRYSRSKGKDKRFVFRYNDYMDALLEVPANDPGAMGSPAYAQYIYELPYSLWYAEVNWSMTDKPPYTKIVADQYTMRDSLAKKYFKGAVYELALYAILLDVVKDAAKKKGTPEFDAAYNQSNDIINRMSKRFTNNLYYSRVRSKLEELVAVQREETRPKPKPKRK